MPNESNIPGRISYTLIGAAGVCGHLALAVYYAGVLVPQADFTGDLSPAQLMENIKQHQSAILLDGYLQGIGTLLSVIFFAGLVFLSRAGRRLSGWIVLITASVML